MSNYLQILYFTLIYEFVIYFKMFTNLLQKFAISFKIFVIMEFKVNK